MVLEELEEELRQLLPICASLLAAKGTPVKGSWEPVPTAPCPSWVVELIGVQAGSPNLLSCSSQAKVLPYCVLGACEGGGDKHRQVRS